MTPPRALRQLVLFLLLALPLIARAGPFAGLDRDGDFSCSPDDMGPTHTWGEVGTVDSFQVYFADIPDLYAYSCFFCVQETASINFHSWTYHHPPGWTEVPIKNSEDHGLVITPWVSSAYPNVKCWQVEATDFTFSSPMSFPAAIGTL